MTNTRTGSDIALPSATRLSLADQVTSLTRDAIINGGLQPGKRLVESELAEYLKVSRGPVREALRRLEQEGLVRIKPASGTFVATLTEEDIKDIYGVRAALEGYAASIAAAGHFDVTPLDAVLAQMQSSFRARDLSGIIEADVAFHRGLISLGNNRRLLTAWKTLEGQTRLILSLTRDQVYRDPERLVEQHRALGEAIRSRNSEYAEKRVREHIEARVNERLASWREILAIQGTAAPSHS
jgi:DNA-binding GntR family transcriptional regulator